MDLGALNWLAVAAAAVAGIVIGSVWYSRRVFGNRWMTGLGKRPEDLGPSGGPIAIAVISYVVMAVVLALLLPADATLGTGVLWGLLAWAGFVATSTIIGAVFESRNADVTMISVTNGLVILVVMGAILGAWR